MFCKYGACEPFEHWLSCVLVLFVALFFVVDLFTSFKTVCSVLLCTYFVGFVGSCVLMSLQLYLALCVGDCFPCCWWTASLV